MSKKTNRRQRPTRRYLEQPHMVAALALPEDLVEPGALYVQQVAHDAWCDLLLGRGLCNCLPDITLVRLDDEQEAC